LFFLNIKFVVDTIWDLTSHYGWIMNNSSLHISKAMTSFGSDGGIVSTSADMLIFIEAFFTGNLFPTEYINKLYQNLVKVN